MVYFDEDTCSYSFLSLSVYQLLLFVGKGDVYAGACITLPGRLAAGSPPMKKVLTAGATTLTTDNEEDHETDTTDDEEDL